MVLALVGGACGSNGGSTDGGARDGGADGHTTCMLLQPPDRPDASGDGTQQTLVVLPDISLDQGERWRTIGFDIDGRCSPTPDADGECFPPGGTDVESDGSGGIDNSFGHHMYQVLDATTDGSLQDRIHSRHDEGQDTPVLIVRGWNGRENDASVDVVLVQAVFGTPAQPDGSKPPVTVDGSRATLPDGSEPPPPAWDGLDYFWARSDSFVDGNEERPRTITTGFVRDGLVTASFESPVQLLLATENIMILMELRRLSIVAPIMSSATAATASGIWQRPSEDVRCVDDAETAEIAGVVDEVSDISVGPDSEQCDGISVGLEFSVVGGQWGGIIDPTPPPCL